MTDLQSLVERMAREALLAADWTGDDAAPYDRFTFNQDGLERFAQLVAEECAKVAAELDDHGEIAPAIRERFGIKPGATR